MKLLICFGTRPEYIKVKSLIDNLDNIKTCFTGQHVDLLKNINVDYRLTMDKMSDNRLNNIFCNILSFNNIFEDIDYVLVQGDTSTALSIAISAFNNNKKIIHLEAGLRSKNFKDPYPEEMNRQLISRIADINLCPTEFNKNSLLKENVFGTLHVTGNTGLDNINKDNVVYGNFILITLHRRDNHHNINEWFSEIERLANENRDLQFVIPIHPNPDVQKHKHIFKTVQVINPMDHSSLIDFIKKCKFVISDSGGLQEECSFLNKKIIVCRKTTERPETIGTHSVMCFNPENLRDIFYNVKNDFDINEICPYGDGNAWRKVKSILQKL
jgi:UDP-N-acetylglucosamine 2-epimerase (non-hydrolysing)